MKIEINDLNKAYLQGEDDTLFTLIIEKLEELENRINNIENKSQNCETFFWINP